MLDALLRLFAQVPPKTPVYVEELEGGMASGPLWLLGLHVLLKGCAPWGVSFRALDACSRDETVQRLTELLAHVEPGGWLFLAWTQPGGASRMTELAVQAGWALAQEATTVSDGAITLVYGVYRRPGEHVVA